MAVFDGAVFDSVVFDTGAVVVQQQPSGGWVLPLPGKSRKRVHEERIALGILPEPVQEVVRALTPTTTIQEAPDRLLAALERQNIEFKALYAEVLRQEIARQAEEEEVAILLLMH